MDFKEMRLPLEMSAWMVGGPMWSTRGFTTQNGDVTRLGLWDYPLHKFDISAGMRSVPDAAKTKLFHLRARGKLYGFRVHDPHDYSAIEGEGFLIATATAGVYQLVKRYTEDGDTFQRIIKKPIPGTVTVYKLDVAVTGDPVDYSTGLVTITGSSTASQLRWIGGFDVPVCFTDDWLQIGLNSGGLLNWNNATVLELRRIDSSFGTPPALADALFFPVGGAPAPAPTPPPPPPAGGPTPPFPEIDPDAGYVDFGPGEAGDSFNFQFTVSGATDGTGLEFHLNFHYAGLDFYGAFNRVPTPTDFDHHSTTAAGDSGPAWTPTRANGVYYLRAIASGHIGDAGSYTGGEFQVYT